MTKTDLNKLTPEELEAKAKEFGVSTEGLNKKATVDAVHLAMEAKKAEEAGDGAGDGEDGDELIEGGYFYWIKYKTYISDEETIDAGLYHFDEKIERLEGVRPTVAEVFEGEINAIDLAGIADWAGLSYDKKKFDEEAILNELLK